MFYEKDTQIHNLFLGKKIKSKDTKEWFIFISIFSWDRKKQKKKELNFLLKFLKKRTEKYKNFRLKKKRKLFWLRIFFP